MVLPCCDQWPCRCISALACLGAYYLSGLGGEKDCKLGLHLIQVSAKTGCKHALENIANIEEQLGLAVGKLQL